MTGIGIDTLRAWERRHDAVRPVRDDRGRMYSTADVQRLRLLRDAVANGHAIGRIAHLDTAHLKEAARPQPAATPTEARRPSALIDVATLLDALDRFDGAFIETELGRAASLMSVRDFLDQLLFPALREVGVRWSQGAATVAHEHLLASIVRGVLGVLARSYRRTDTGARVVVATPASELHELGALGAAVLAASGGLGVIYLGPNLPAADIVRLVGQVGTDIVILGATDAGANSDAIEREVRAVAAGLPTRVELWIGGTAAQRIAGGLHSRAIAIEHYDALTRQLERVGARF